MKKRLTISLSLVICLLAVGAAGAAMVRYGPFVLRADGGFKPRVLPRRAFAPIDFHGHAEIEMTDSQPPPALQSAWILFDRDGRIATAGLPACPPERIEGTKPEEARRLCGGAIVGTGHVAAAVTLPGQPTVEVRSPLTLFNGPRENGHATLIAHARATFPSPETYVVTVAIERHGPQHRYLATFDVPPIAGGYGALTHVDLKIGKRYRYRGAERSYLSARCSDGIFETWGRFAFANGMIVSGTVFKPCRTSG
jgi:hypothetical protein